MEIDDKFRQLIKELGNAINESLSESGKINEVLGRIRAQGYDLFLVLEVTIGFNNKGVGGRERPGRSRTGATRRKGIQEFHLTSQDAEFLRDLKISVDGESR